MQENAKEDIFSEVTFIKQMAYLLRYSSEKPKTSMWVYFLPQNVWGVRNTVQEAMTFNFGVQTQSTSDIFTNPGVTPVGR